MKMIINTIKVILLSAMITFMNWLPVLSQEVKVYEGPYNLRPNEAGHQMYFVADDNTYIKYHYYEDEKGNRIWHGDVTFKINDFNTRNPYDEWLNQFRNGDNVLTIKATLKHGVYHGEFTRIYEEKDTRGTYTYLAKDRNSAKIIIDENGKKQTVYNTKEATGKHGLEAYLRKVTGKFNNGQLDGTWTVEDSSGVKTYVFDNSELVKECSSKVPLNEKGLRHGKYQGEGFEEEWYNGFRVYYKEFDEATGKVIKDWSGSDLKPRIDRVLPYAKLKEERCELFMDLLIINSDNKGNFEPAEIYREGTTRHPRLFYKGFKYREHVGSLEYLEDDITNEEYMKTVAEKEYNRRISYNYGLNWEDAMHIKKLIKYGAWVLNDPNELPILNTKDQNIIRFTRFSDPSIDINCTISYGKIDGKFKISGSLEEKGKEGYYPTPVDSIVYSFKEGTLKERTVYYKYKSDHWSEKRYYLPSREYLDDSEINLARQLIEDKEYEKADQKLVKILEGKFFESVKSDVLLLLTYIAYVSDNLENVIKYNKMAEEAGVRSNQYNIYLAYSYSGHSDYKNAEKYQNLYVNELRKNKIDKKDLAHPTGGGVAHLKQVQQYKQNQKELANAESTLWWYQVLNGKVNDYTLIEYPSGEYNPFLDVNKGNYFLLTDNHDKAIDAYFKAMHAYNNKGMDKSTFKKHLANEFSLMNDAGFKIKEKKVFKDLGLKKTLVDVLEEVNNY